MSEPSKPNPADFVVDESMPRYPISLSFTSKPVLSDQEVAAGKPLRLAARKKVSDEYNKFIKHEKDEKNYIKQNWSKETDERRKLFQHVLDSNNSKANKTLMAYLKTELVWWDNNIELSPRQVNERDIKYGNS